MAETGRLRQPAAAARADRPGDAAARMAIILALLAVWEFLSHSGWLYRDVVPSLLSIARAIVDLLSHANYYYNLAVTAGEIGLALLIGGLSGWWSASCSAPTASCRRPSSPISIISGRRPRSSSSRS